MDSRAGDIGEKEPVIRVDSKTKLPLSMVCTKCKPGQGVMRVDHFEYDVTIPAGTLGFTVPEGAWVDCVEQ